MATPEAKVKKSIKEFLDSLGFDCWYFMTHMSGFGRKGIPDIIGCYRGLYFGIEVKSEVGVCSPWQTNELRKIRQAGGIGIVAKSVQDVKDAILPKI
jgi:hypothetical protein